MFEFLKTQWVTLLRDHPVFFAMVLVPVVSLICNALISYLTSAEWPALLARSPRLAAACKLAKAIGIDPVSVVRWTFTIVTGRVWGEPPATKEAKTE